MEKITRYIVSHKGNINCELYEGKNLILVGNAKSNFSNVIYDDTLDNISIKNPTYCELTALYWIYKNDISSSIISFEHYRRVFSKKNIRLSLKNDLKEEDIVSYLKDFDIILPKKIDFGTNMYDQYKMNHDINDLLLAETAIQELYPEDYEGFNKYFKNNTNFSCYNMFIARKDLLISYCTWLFSILFYCEKYIKFENKDKYNMRVFGFLGERLLNYYVYKKNLKVKYLNVLYLEESALINDLKYIKKKIGGRIK